MPLRLTVTAKGQVTSRQTALEHLGIKPGHKVGVAPSGCWNGPTTSRHRPWI